MTAILALDPGTEQTGFCLLDGRRVLESGVLPNDRMLALVSCYGRGAQVASCAIEMVASYGMPVGREVFETVRWVGRFQQAWRDPEAVRLVYRAEVKSHLCRSQKATDATIWQALVDLFGPGKDKAVGRKASPGPLYGVTSHARSALAVAVTAQEVGRG
ncbi:hypothetical protein [Azohydromonas aeria]|uniref:hypothetical protein n=1 Tax=Azohydromonas aeria TaxID=2590212 RepID=UPI0018DF1A05|nr:hypothetical protein [Azohydromonas aeria]